MPPPKDLEKLISLTQTTQTLLTHFQTSLTAPPASSASPTTTTITSIPPADLPTGTLPALRAATTLLKSHTTTLSLLLLTPPLTPSALIAKITDVTSGPLSGMVAAASHVPAAGARDELGAVLRAEVRAQVKRLVGAWGEVLGVVGERKGVLERTGVVWDVCDEVLRLCDGGVVELVLGKARQLRAVLLDAVEELKEWGEDVADEDEEEDKAEGSGDEGDGFGDEDDFFGAENKIGKDDVELKALLDRSVKKLKMVGIMYQAVGKRRLNTFPVAVHSAMPASTAAASGKATSANSKATSGNSKPTSPPTNPKNPPPNTPPTPTATTLQPPTDRLDTLMRLLTTIPSSADDLASAFYELSEEDAAAALAKVCDEAKSAVTLVRTSWDGGEDEFTVWAGKWVGALDAA
ncbi:hypothetical protein C7974DRAFT_465944 [Boeremia exigua]|uniref:uncharacterized protein n=1 Tax=Boeremia exigua TaxID=749465 RepID=UPI001E8D3BFC|nr:uncharacterized protein C7974DRAFT_465944 [Boeremia exigua]KAH6616852.1 hypothetical protein C7974DRAFT_465944 [Boeremia exigua]